MHEKLADTVMHEADDSVNGYFCNGTKPVAAAPAAAVPAAAAPAAAPAAAKTGYVAGASAAYRTRRRCAPMPYCFATTNIFYIIRVDRYERRADENPPIGIILCTAASREQVELL